MDNARAMFETNFWGAVDLTRETLPLLREGRGRVVMISSVAGIISQPMTSMYCASKRALEGFTDSLRQEVKHFGISVSLVEPAYVKTDLLGKTQAVRTESELSAEELKRRTATTELYPYFFSKKFRDKKLKIMTHGDSPQVTTDAIFDALASTYPKTRYVVASVNGTPAWAIVWFFWAATDRLKDFFIKSM
jgi:NAD(P)-dependent dehydrogenase (short-subunit alcohol dehydrogenase family)